jgi:hypothetical protein
MRSSGIGVLMNTGADDRDLVDKEDAPFESAICFAPWSRIS